MYQEDKIQKKFRITMFILAAILVSGILIQSGMYLAMSRFYPWPAAGGRSVTIEDMELMERMNTRFALRDFGERVCGAAMFIFVVGSAMTLRSFIKNGAPIGFGRLFAFFGGIAAAIAACTVPFAIADRESWGNYFFMLWGFLPIMALLLLILLWANLVKWRKANPRP